MTLSLDSVLASFLGYKVDWSVEFFERALHSLYRSSQDSPSTVWLPPVVVCVVIVLVFYSSRNRPHRPRSWEPQQVLSTVITPTSVAWPKDYAQLVDHSSSSRARTLVISLSSLMRNIREGTVEIRNHDDLPEILSDKLVVYGWRVGLGLDTFWNLEVLRWAALNHFSWKKPIGTAERRPVLKRMHGSSTPKDEGPQKLISFSLIANTNSQLDLDYTHFSHLEASILHIRNSLTPGTFETLEFTTPSQPIPFLSAQFILCSIPFLPRKYAIHTRTPPRYRTSTPVLASINRILELLTAGPTLERVVNVSEQYAAALNVRSLHLEDDKDCRAAFIQQWGLAGWREERLMMAWEAALFSAGWLTRWVVVIRK
ncbi:hypothetical protein C8J57DRAFT_1708554 [Mycena rebaudengoi]|nr:hypothetical protein C8J57DRAFT_1708554 [Mycena rebaudengoi]